MAMNQKTAQAQQVPVLSAADLERLNDVRAAMNMLLPCLPSYLLPEMSSVADSWLTHPSLKRAASPEEVAVVETDQKKRKMDLMQQVLAAYRKQTDEEIEKKSFEKLEADLKVEKVTKSKAASKDRLTLMREAGTFSNPMLQASALAEIANRHNRPANPQDLRAQVEAVLGRPSLLCKHMPMHQFEKEEEEEEKKE